MASLEHLTVCSYHVTYAFQGESRLYSYSFQGESIAISWLNG